jgi:hypothetical protein
MPTPDSDLAIAQLQAQLEELKAQRGYGVGTPQDHIPAGKVPTTAKAWKKANADTDLTLPSGNICRVKRPGLPALLKMNILPDELSSIAMEAVEQGETGAPDHDANNKKIAELMGKGSESIEMMVDATARIAAACILEPPVSYHREKFEGGPDGDFWEEIPESKRDPDVLYTDEVDFNDLVFIFQFVVGGSRDLEEFRKTTG